MRDATAHEAHRNRPSRLAGLALLAAGLGLVLHDARPLHAQAGTTGGTPQRGSFKKQVRPSAGKPTANTAEAKREKKLPPKPELLTGGQ